MSTSFPLGEFARGRRDWSIQQISFGSVNSTGGNNAVRASLNNDSQTGNYLALYGVLAWRSAYPQLFTLYSGVSIAAVGIPTVSMLILGRGKIDGLVTVDVGVFAEGQPGAVIFVGDGKSWLTMGDLPLMVIPPGYRASVRNFQSIGNFPIADPTAVTFAWGYYRDARPPRLRGR